jgi:hypothetical protein
LSKSPPLERLTAWLRARLKRNQKLGLPNRQRYIDCATLDVGYSLFRGPNSKIGGFVGYNYCTENKSAYGCTPRSCGLRTS